MKNTLLTLSQLSSTAIVNLIKTALDMKANPGAYAATLSGKGLGLLFQKPSSRTRVSFEAGINQLGGYSVYLAPEDVMFGEREPIKDMARCFSGYLDAIVIRTFAQDAIEEFAAFSSIPVINGLTDLFHPCQAMADGLTIYEHAGTLEGITLTYVGDGNNVAHSLMMLAAKCGMHMRIATPAGYEPDETIIAASIEAAAASGGSIMYCHDPINAACGADFLYTDVWTSMGQESEGAARRKAFSAFQLNTTLCAAAKPGVKIMHCLPAHRGEEITDELVESAASVIFQQAENRLHIQKAVLLDLMGE